MACMTGARAPVGGGERKGRWVTHMPGKLNESGGGIPGLMQYSGLINLILILEPVYTERESVHSVQ